KLGHERLAEPHYLTVGATLGIEVAASLAPTDGQSSQRVLEDLLEAEEFDDAQVDAGMKPQAPLVRAQGGVELHAETTVDLHGPRVIHPGNAEDDLTFGLA